MEPLGSAAAVPAATNPTFLFIPGSFHPGALFDRVILEIGKRGFPSVAIDRPSIVQASNSTLDPYADVQAIRAKVEGLVVQEGKDIILVCHSAGGVVGSRSVKGYEKTAMMHRNVKGGIIGVWFLAAFLLKDGVNIIATLGGGVPDWVDDETNVRRPNALAPSVLFNDMEESAQKYWTAQLRAQNKRGGMFPAGQACWDVAVPKHYLFTTNDEATDPALQLKMFGAVQDASWSVSVLDSGHEPFLSRPDELANLLVSKAVHIISSEAGP